MIPQSCSYVSDLSKEDANIKLEHSFTIHRNRSGNERESKIQIYSIKDGNQVGTLID